VDKQQQTIVGICIAGILLGLILIVVFLQPTPQQIENIPQTNEQETNNTLCLESCSACEFDEVCETNGIKTCINSNCETTINACSRELPLECYIQGQSDSESITAKAIRENNVDECDSLGGAEAQLCASEFYYNKFLETKDVSFCGKIIDFNIKMKCLNYDDEPQEQEPLIPTDLGNRTVQTSGKKLVESGKNFATYEISGDPDNDPSTTAMVTEVYFEPEEIRFATLSVPVSTVTGMSPNYGSNSYEWIDNVLTGRAYCRTLLGFCAPGCDCSIEGDAQRTFSSDETTETINLPNWQSQNSVEVELGSGMWGNFVISRLIFGLLNFETAPWHSNTSINIKKSGTGSFFSTGFLGTGTCFEPDVESRCNAIGGTEIRHLMSGVTPGTGLVLDPDPTGNVDVTIKLDHEVSGDSWGVFVNRSGYVSPNPRVVVYINWNRNDDPPTITAQVCSVTEGDETIISCAPTLPNDTQLLKCITTYSDPEGDRAAEAYSWEANGSAVPFEENQTISLGGFTRTNPNTFRCTFTVNPLSPSTQPDVSVTSLLATVDAVSNSGGLVLHMPFDTDFSDSSTFNNNGTPMNGATITETGKLCGALELDGTDDFVEVLDSGSLDIENEITIAAWVNTENLNGTRMIVSKYFRQGFRDNYAMMLVSSSLFGSLEKNCFRCLSAWFGTDRDVPANTWKHVALTYDGAQAKLYVDGQLKETLDETGAIGTNNEPLHIGAEKETSFRNPNPPFQDFFSGKIDDLRIYSRVLSQSEIQALTLETCNEPEPETPTCTIENANPVNIPLGGTTDVTISLENFTTPPSNFGSLACGDGATASRISCTQTQCTFRCSNYNSAGTFTINNLSGLTNGSETANCNGSAIVNVQAPINTDCSDNGGTCRNTCPISEERVPAFTCSNPSQICCIDVCPDSVEVNGSCGCGGVIINDGYCCEGIPSSTQCSEPTQNNLVGINLETDKKEYGNENAAITVTVAKKAIGFGGNAGVALKAIREKDSMQITLPVSSMNFNFALTDPVGETEQQLFTLNTGSLQSGVYTLTAEITQTMPENDTIRADNIDSETIIIKPRATVAAPEIHPIFVVLIVFAVLMILKRN